MTKKQWIWLVVGVGVASQVPTMFFRSESASKAAAKPSAPNYVVLTPEQHRLATEDTSKPKAIPPKENFDISDLPPMDGADHMIGAVINLNGYLCARPTLVQPAGSPDLYAVQCITYRDGRGISNYLVNSRTNDVKRI